MAAMNNKLLLLLIIGITILGACDAILGSKNDNITKEIFEEGKKDPNVIVDEVGYAALLPFWDDFKSPTDVYVGYDELVYVTDEDGLHVLDRAGRKYDLIPLRGAVAVTQDRLLNVYVAARYDTVITAVDPDIVWDLAAVYKIKNANGAGPVQIVDILVHPFMDNSRSTTTAQQRRLDRTRADNEELVEITGIAALANNNIYVSRRGPSNATGQAAAADNTILIYDEVRNSEGKRTGKMRNTSQIRALNPGTPSLLSAIQVNDISAFVGPPQRENISNNLGFIVAQGAPQRDIPYRVLWVDAVETPDGLEYRANGTLLTQDTTRAESFLYEQGKFRNPSGVAFSADARAHLFVVDAISDSLYMFQSNGFEGVNPLPGSSITKVINVSFGGTGSGPRQFNNPSGVAYFDEIVYVADTGNNRISRFKLTTDFE